MKTTLIITSIAAPNKILKDYGKECKKRNIPFIVIGDVSSPKKFEIDGCNFYSMERQATLKFEYTKVAIERHYSRKNLGYLLAAASDTNTIVETDDDNIPYDSFWERRNFDVPALYMENKDWVNVYKYFTQSNIWPRGFAMEKLQDPTPDIKGIEAENKFVPIQQGLANENPDVDAIYRSTIPLPQNFEKHANIALGKNCWCPFNSQNTSWHRDAFPLLYLPSYCSFRMTDIWRSFVAQRIAWTCDWGILFHEATVYQERNEHNLMKDFEDEIPGYLNNHKICDVLQKLDLKKGKENLLENLRICYFALIKHGWIETTEMTLVDAWIEDMKKLGF